ncbi:MAG TPA: helix-turn-helix transcriptional regulator [Syntrophomonadaceae bacterium]|nr:helix-turn-helix transcriptional regulator [Syntrophomonadaceae bacterium]
MDDNYGQGSFPPWSRIPSLKEMTDEAGVDHDHFIALIELGYTTGQMAENLQISESTVSQLKEHFFKFGISSVIGGD